MNSIKENSTLISDRCAREEAGIDLKKPADCRFRRPELDRRYIDIDYPAIPGYPKYPLPFPGCRLEEPDQSGLIAGIVEQFTSVLQSMFSVLEQAISGLVGLLGKQQEQTPAPSPQPDPSPEPAPAPSPDQPAPPLDQEVVMKKAKNIGNSGEFLWKPVSDSDGKCVVLLPSNLTGKIKSVKIVDKNGHVIEQGVSKGVGNGNREHFRFSKEGNGYPDGCFVYVELSNGKFKKIKIKETSNRITK